MRSLNTLNEPLTTSKNRNTKNHTPKATQTATSQVNPCPSARPKKRKLSQQLLFVCLLKLLQKISAQARLAVVFAVFVAAPSDSVAQAEYHSRDCEKVNPVKRVLPTRWALQLTKMTKRFVQSLTLQNSNASQQSRRRCCCSRCLRACL